MKSSRTLALGSVAVSLVVLGVKFYAYAVTGSVALFSDALESIINVATAGAALWALQIAEQPADARHPYGHSKAEYLSAVAEGVLIVGAAVVILWQAALAIHDPRSPEQPLLGLSISAIGTALNLVWSLVLKRQARALRSPALAADARHLMADVVTSLGVVAGLVLVFATGKPIIDPVIAALVALHVLWSGWLLTKESVGGLMDEAVPDDRLARIREVIACTAEGAIEAHDIKSRCAGKLTFVEFHLVVPGDMSVTSAHDICDRVERALTAEIPDTSVSIHVEPDDKRKHSGIVVL